ncbi:MAG: MarR family transcriptional regulator [Alicyclobacillaceae bacterium]|nr:MarR family transcriptional regulator [Alicyclobacillaceae bacterium]
MNQLVWKFQDVVSLVSELHRDAPFALLVSDGRQFIEVYTNDSRLDVYQRGDTVPPGSLLAVALTEHVTQSYRSAANHIYPIPHRIISLPLYEEDVMWGVLTVVIGVTSIESEYAKFIDVNAKNISIDSIASEIGRSSQQIANILYTLSKKISREVHPVTLPSETSKSNPLESWDETLGDRLETALGLLLLRRTRSQLYDELVSGVHNGLDSTVYPVLSGIARSGPISVTQLSSDIGLDRSNTSRRASQLEENGLLHRVPDDRDARVALLTLTPLGEKVVNEMRFRLKRRLTAQLSAWTLDEAECFVHGLERFVSEWVSGDLQTLN